MARKPRRQIGRLRFHAPQLGCGSASPLGRCCRRRTLRAQTFVFRFGRAPRLRQQFGRRCDCLCCRCPRRFGRFGRGCLLAAARFEFRAFGCESRRIVGDDAHMSRGPFDLLYELPGLQFTCDLLAFRAADLLVQEHQCIFERDELRACSRD